MDINKDLPQLIVALDSLDDSANYIHIADVKENTDYYCPCCKGLVKPRAFKKDIDYQVQPHFYHEFGGCNEETYVHFICKNWLFEQGCKFIVCGVEYEVDDIEVEKTLHTSFGDYLPDIIVTTTSNKTFYFEIKSTNRKTEHYIPKWDELGNDVVEVDVRYFINQKYKNNIPIFNLIYSDGECFIKSYTRNDYDTTIAKRKLEWKRQDKLNYKIQWEKLDWFWNELTSYKNGKNNLEYIKLLFSELEYDDMDFFMIVIKKMSCQDLYDELIDIINKKFITIVKSYDVTPYEEVKFIQESPRIFYIAFQICHVDNYCWFNSYFINRKVKYYDKKILNLFLKAINSDDFGGYTAERCPCFEEIRYLKYKKSLVNNSVSFYLKDRIAAHWNYANKRYSRIFDDSEPITIQSYLIGYQHIKDIISKDNNITLSKKQHIGRMQQNRTNMQNRLKVDFLIKHINNCKNGYWRSYLSTNVFGESNIKIELIINGYYIDAIEIGIDNKNKYQIFKEIKLSMQKLILNAGNSRYGDLRIMEVQD